MKEEVIKGYFEKKKKVKMILLIKKSRKWCLSIIVDNFSYKEKIKPKVIK